MRHPGLRHDLVQLSGEWDPDADKVVHLLLGVEDRLIVAIQASPNKDLGEAAAVLYENISAVSGPLLRLCKNQRRVPTMIAYSLLRTVIDGCVSIFALCIAPAKRAKMVLDYQDLLGYKMTVLLAHHIGCPLLPKQRFDKTKVKQAVKSAHATALLVGKPFLKPTGKRKPNKCLKKEVAKGRGGLKSFRDTWYPEERLSLLKSQGMGWVNDVLYKPFSSAVHATGNIAAILGTPHRMAVTSLSLQFFSMALLQLVDIFEVGMSEEETKTVRFLCDYGLQKKKDA